MDATGNTMTTGTDTQKWISFLSGRKITLAIIGIAVISRVIQLIYFYTTGFDLSYQVMATHNFVTGHGISISLVSPSDLSTIIYEPLTRWPPGYTVLLSPFYILYGQHYIAAGLTLDILAAVTLILVSSNLLKLLGVSLPFVNLYTLLTGFFIYQFYFIASSDAIAITAFVIALYFAVSLLITGGSSMKKTIGMIVFLFICGFTKYLFIPVVMIIPAYIFLRGRADRNRILQKAGAWSFFVLALTLGLVLLYQKYTSGSATYISETGRGFFPEHLATAYPFIPGSFIKTDTLSLLLKQDTAINGWIYRSFQVIHLLAFFFIIVYVLKRLFRRGLKDSNTVDDFFYLAFFISITITIILSILSLWVPKEEIMPGVLWTYIQEPRYYGLANILLHLSVLIALQVSERSWGKWTRYAFYFILLLMTAELVRGAIFTGNRIVRMGKESYAWQLDHRFQRFAAAIIQDARKEQPVEKVIVTGTSLYINHRVAVYSHTPILLDPYHLNDLTALHSREKVLVLFIVEEKALPFFQPVIDAAGMKRGGYSSGFYFYTFYHGPV